MTTDQDAARQLKLQMSILRERIEDQKEEATAQTLRALDWKYQVAKHPILTTAIVMTVGYWLIPPRRKPLQPLSLSENKPPIANPRQNSSTFFNVGKTLVLAAASMVIKNVASGAINQAISSFTEWQDRNQPADNAKSTGKILSSPNEGMPDEN